MKANKSIKAGRMFINNLTGRRFSIVLVKEDKVICKDESPSQEKYVISPEFTLEYDLFDSYLNPKNGKDPTFRLIM